MERGLLSRPGGSTEHTGSRTEGPRPTHTVGAPQRRLGAPGLTTSTVPHTASRGQAAVPDGPRAGVHVCRSPSVFQSSTHFLCIYPKSWLSRGQGREAGDSVLRTSPLLTWPSAASSRWPPRWPHWAMAPTPLILTPRRFCPPSGLAETRWGFLPPPTGTGSTRSTPVMRQLRTNS